MPSFTSLFTESPIGNWHAKFTIVNNFHQSPFVIPKINFALPPIASGNLIFSKILIMHVTIK